jgi:hypothetical protein
VTNTEYEFIGWEALLEVWAPRVLGAVLILIAAWFIGRAIKWALAKGVDKLPGADRHNEGLERRQTVGAKLGDVALWTVLLFGVVAALGVLNLGGAVAPLNTLLNTVAGAIPNIVAAALIFFVGFIVATLARRVVSAALQAANADGWLQKSGVGRTTGSTGVSDAVGTLVFVLILIPVTIAALEKLAITVITEPAVAVLSTVFDALPRVIAAAIVLAIGLFIGRWVAGLIERILPATGFDRSIQSLIGLSSLKPTASATPPASAGASPYAGAVSPAYAAQIEGAAPPAKPLTPSRVVGMIAMIAIVLFTAVEAARLIGFASVAAILAGVLDLAGRVLVGGIIITAGVLIADVLATLINRGTAGADRFASTIVRWATIALATAMGLSFMGIADEIVVLAFGLILGSAAVAAALAFGLGGRETAGKLLSQWTQGGQRITPASTDRRPPPPPPFEPEPRPFQAGQPESGV